MKMKKQTLKNLLKQNSTYSAVFNSLSDENKEQILEYLSGGKGVILYEIVKSPEDLNCVHENEFFSMSEFYSSLKNEIITDNKHKIAKKFW